MFTDRLLSFSKITTPNRTPCIWHKYCVYWFSTEFPIVPIPRKPLRPLIYLCRPVPLSILFNRYRRQKINFQRLLLFPESSSSAKPTHATHDCYDLTLPCLLRSLSLPVVGKKMLKSTLNGVDPGSENFRWRTFRIVVRRWTGGQVDSVELEGHPDQGWTIQRQRPKKRKSFSTRRASSCVSFTICR